METKDTIPAALLADLLGFSWADDAPDDAPLARNTDAVIGSDRLTRIDVEAAAAALSERSASRYYSR